jgi:hypothetical protein
VSKAFKCRIQIMTLPVFVLSLSAALSVDGLAQRAAQTATLRRPPLPTVPPDAEWPAGTRASLERAIKNYDADPVSAYCMFAEALSAPADVGGVVIVAQRTWLESSPIQIAR